MIISYAVVHGFLILLLLVRECWYPGILEAFILVTNLLLPFSLSLAASSAMLRRPAEAVEAHVLPT